MRLGSRRLFLIIPLCGERKVWNHAKQPLVQASRNLMFE